MIHVVGLCVVPVVLTVFPLVTKLFVVLHQLNVAGITMKVSLGASLVHFAVVRAI